jgi:ATP-dependent DNA ligase
VLDTLFQATEIEVQTKTPVLGWYPPAPAPGPISILRLAPDDWSLCAKMNGCRVIIQAGRIFTRQGTPLTKPKGSERLAALLSCDLPANAITLEGEWCDSIGRLYLFDLPGHPGTYDQRRAELGNIVRLIAWEPHITLMPAVCGLNACNHPANLEMSFREAYRWWREQGAEGVVLKRRLSRYQKCQRPGTVIRDWLKYRFSWRTA